MQENDSPTAENSGGISQPPQLSAIELRVLGSILEKQLTTPDQYPLTVNSIITACNQKSSREPVTSYQQGEVVHTLQGLEDNRFVRKEFSSRSDKYSQQFIARMELSKKHQALLCVMMLRGPQTLSELATRTQRMDQFTDKEDVMHCLERLCERDVPFVKRLGSQPGQRGERFIHLLGDLSVFDGDNTAPPVGSNREIAPNREQRVPDPLVRQVSELREQVEQLTSENKRLSAQIQSLYELTGHSLSTDTQSPQD